jgi:OOP family OmpA-OmpF porin
LSQKRADAVKMTLINEFKVDAARVSAVGYGEANPIADNATADGRSKNRRVVGVVKAKVEKAATK